MKSAQFFLWIMNFQKICYDNPGNVPNKGTNFNTQKFGENVFICYLYD